MKGEQADAGPVTCFFGPGYRIYFGRDGGELVILLAGGIKSRQQGDIETAQARWVDYKKRRLHRAP